MWGPLAGCSQFRPTPGLFGAWLSCLTTGIVLNCAPLAVLLLPQIHVAQGVEPDSKMFYSGNCWWSAYWSRGILWQCLSAVTPFSTAHLSPRAGGLTMQPVNALCDGMAW